MVSYENLNDQRMNKVVSGVSHLLKESPKMAANVANSITFPKQEV